MRTPLRVTATVLSVMIVGLGFASPATAAPAGPAAAAASAAAAAPTVTVRASARSGGYIRSHAEGSTASENVSTVFVVPTASCAALPAGGGSVTIGASVDGAVRKSAVKLEGGVLISCASNTAAPRYQIFWAQAPKGPQVLGSTKPGHEIYVFVSSDDFQPVNVSDNTTGVLYAGSTGAYVTDHSSVQCLVSAGTTGSGAVRPLPAFGTVTFRSCIDFSGGSDSRQLADPTSAGPGEATYQVQDNIGHVRTRTSARKANGTWGVTWVAAT